MLAVTSRRPAVQLTPRETRILDLMRAGLDTKAIGHRLRISPWTVYRHLERARTRNATATTAQLIDLYARTRARRSRRTGADGNFD